jgi:hypothetical protein
MSDAYATISRTMPDNDIVPKGTRRAWRPAAELAIGGHPPDLVGDECGRALARELRETGDAATVADLAKALSDAIETNDRGSYIPAAAAIVQNAGRSPLAVAVAAEGERMLEMTGGAPGAEALLEGGLRRFVAGALFGSEAMLIRMHQGTGISLGELDSYKDEVLGSVPSREIAAAIVGQPAAEVRAPARRVRATTAEMLGEEVL